MSFKKLAQQWICNRCGYVVSSAEEPKRCPGCNNGEGFHYSSGADDHDGKILLSED